MNFKLPFISLVSISVIAIATWLQHSISIPLFWIGAVAFIIIACLFIIVALVVNRGVQKDQHPIERDPLSKKNHNPGSSWKEHWDGFY